MNLSLKLQTQTLNSSCSTSVKQMPPSLEVMGSKSAVYWALFILLSSKSFMQRCCTTDFPWNKWFWFIFLRGILFFPLQYFPDFCLKKRFKIFIHLAAVTKTRTSKTDHASLPLEKPQKVLRTHFLKTSVSFHFSFLNSRLKLDEFKCHYQACDNLPLSRAVNKYPQYQIHFTERICLWTLRIKPWAAGWEEWTLPPKYEIISFFGMQIECPLKKVEVTKNLNWWNR